MIEESEPITDIRFFFYLNVSILNGMYPTN